MHHHVDIIYILLAGLLLHLATSTSNNTGSIAVLVPGGDTAAEALAARHGMRHVSKIGGLPNYFLIKHDNHKLHNRSLDLLAADPDVAWIEQQHERKRSKRDDSTMKSMVQDNLPLLEYMNDPLLYKQWYLSHMNVQAVWARGITGKGVVVAIVDDGIQRNHPDLAPNYDEWASTDVVGNSEDPTPTDNGMNYHGTRCAGEVAAVAHNGICGVGVAHHASIGGIRVLTDDQPTNDVMEAQALTFNISHVDIYSGSWGPLDDGKTVEGPGHLTKMAFATGTSVGRNGLGSIYVWASGNGGMNFDNCNCDGYANSIFTLSVSSATRRGLKPYYLEECSSTLATTSSSGNPLIDDDLITTVDQDAEMRPERLCTTKHSGTSASAPIAAGIVALALQANPSLTWRDVQYLVVLSSNPKPLLKESGWSVNGVGRKFSHKFGYGLMDADHIVQLASSWMTLPQQHICQTPVKVANARVPDDLGHGVNVSMRTGACIGSVNSVHFLEHVQCTITLKFYPRGSIQLALTSPSGTRSILLLPRPKDETSFEDWPMMSVHFWGENPVGTWMLEILNMGQDPPTVKRGGELIRWQLTFYGTESNPAVIRDQSTLKNSTSTEVDSTSSIMT